MFPFGKLFSLAVSMGFLGQAVHACTCGSPTLQHLADHAGGRISRVEVDVTSVFFCFDAALLEDCRYLGDWVS